MKKQTKNLVLGSAVIVLVAAGMIAWQASRSGSDSERKVSYYQDSMHPWVKSGQPGKCTICAMDLTPIFEGDAGFGSAENVIVLSSNNITALNVQTAEVLRKPLHKLIRAAGVLEADNTRKTVIGAPAPGRIDDVAIESVGVHVQRGQVLASFYSPDLTFQTRRYIFRDRIAGGEAITSKENTRGSSRHMPHMNESTNSNPLPVTPGTDPFYNDLLAPQAGTVVERNVFDGQYVAEGDRLFVVVDFSTMWFRFDVYEQQLPWMAPGQEVDVVVPAVPGRVFKARISVIEPAIVDATRTAKVRATVENPLAGGNNGDRLLRLGMYAEARVGAGIPNALVVPRSAILFPGGQAYAYVDKGKGAYEMRPVNLGRQGDTEWEVLSGLEEGERVVTSGNVLIDAQAQFVQAVQAPGLDEKSEQPETVDRTEPLKPEQLKALTDFVGIAGGISAALAADNLDETKKHVAQLPSIVLALEKAMENEPGWHELVDRIEDFSKWANTADISAARKSFLPFSTSVIPLVEKLRGQEEAFKGLKVFFCPMAPKPGLWFQKEGDLRNPYFGAKMLECGEEIKPKARPRALIARLSRPEVAAVEEDSKSANPVVIPVKQAKTSGAPIDPQGPDTKAPVMRTRKAGQQAASGNGVRERLEEALRTRDAQKAQQAAKASFRSAETNTVYQSTQVIKKPVRDLSQYNKAAGITDSTPDVGAGTNAHPEHGLHN